MITQRSGEALNYRFGTPMRVRLQMGHGTRVQRDRPKNQRLPLAAAVLLTPFAVLAAIFAIWRLAADMDVASNFLFANGALSHWAVWGATAVALGWTTHRLNRYGSQEESNDPAEPGAR
jgi:hypothetical protein